MPDHRFMYPKVVPVAAATAAPDQRTAVHNFVPQNLRTSLQASGGGHEQPKRSPSL
jgi:hypothetical protein